MPTIEFRTFNKESYAKLRPVAAREMQPEWWKKQKVRVDPVSYTHLRAHET